MMTTQPPTPAQPDPELETDARFPSGPWLGFFLMSHLPGRHEMELRLTFKHGTMSGEGHDRIGHFLIRGRYQVEDGRCWWTKRYVGRHDVSYQGYNEGKGIWGLWEIPPSWRGGFHIWPEAMGDPNQKKLAEELDEPVEFDAGIGGGVDSVVEVGEPATAGTGSY